MIIEKPTVVREDPTIIHTTEVRESTAGWWIGAIVAVIAILAVVYLVTRQPSPTQADLSNAAEQGRLTGALEATQSNASNDSAAQAAANAAQINASQAAQRAADAADRANAATSVALHKIDTKLNSRPPPPPAPAAPPP